MGLLFYGIEGFFVLWLCLVMCPCFGKVENFIHDRKIIAVELLYKNLEK